MPQYQGQFYTGQQATGDVLREILQGIRTGRQDSAAVREQRRLEQEREQLRLDRAEERDYGRGRDAAADARLTVQDAEAKKNGELARALNLADLRKRGVMQGAAPTNVTDSVDLSGIGGVGRSFVQNPTRYTQLTDGFYEDEAKTPDALAGNQRRLIARIAQRAAAGDASALGEGVANGMSVAELNGLNPTARVGTPEYLAAQRAELELKDQFDARQQSRQVAGQLRVAGARAAQGAREGATPKLGDVLQFRTQYANDATVKAATEVASSVTIARKAASGDTGISDVSLVYAAAKAMDPTSVVREGEFATIEKSQSIPQRFLSMARRAESGQRLTPEMRADLVNAIEDRGDAARAALQPVRQRFSGMAQTYGLPLDQTVYDPFDTIKPREQAGKRLTPRDVTGIEPRPR